jgi:ligand-binding SRPBCC domain-containing protein
MVEPVPMTHQVQFEQWVPAAIERVFLFFANPGNLPRIMPPETGTELVGLKLAPPPGAPAVRASITDRDPLAGIGSEIVTSFRIVSFLPFRAQWIALITEFEWNHHFADVQEKGPFKSFHHRHELRAESRNGVNGTVVRDAIEYDLGFGWLGGLVQRFFVSRQLRRTFEYRQKALEKLLG